MKGTDLAKLRQGLPKPTSASEVARRLGYSRQWISHKEGLDAEIDDSLALGYAGVIEKLRAEQAGYRDSVLEVSWYDVRPRVAGHESGYEGGVAEALAYLRAHPGERTIGLRDVTAAQRAIVAAVDVFDRAGVDVRFILDDERHILRTSKRP